jgi:hypothetical protein
MLMRFTVEQRHLTDMNGKPLPNAGEVTFQTYDAESIEDLVKRYVRGEGEAEVLGDVLKFPGFQAFLTVRKPSGVYTLQITLASQQGLRVP